MIQPNTYAHLTVAYAYLLELRSDTTHRNCRKGEEGKEEEAQVKEERRQKKREREREREESRPGD